jgi:hypothetical protein
LVLLIRGGSRISSGPSPPPYASKQKPGDAIKPFGGRNEEKNIIQKDVYQEMPGDGFII